VLKGLEDLQYHEIAEVLNLSMGTVMSRLFYARKKLQSMLRPYLQANMPNSASGICAVDLGEGVLVQTVESLGILR
jgi:Sigma-70, region 4